MKDQYFYFAKIGGFYVNYLNIFSKEKILRLKNTILERESLLYTNDQIRKLKKIHPNLKGFIKYPKFN